MIRHAQATEGGEYTPGTRTWIWSDLHLHHRNIIRYSAALTLRPTRFSADGSSRASSSFPARTWRSTRSASGSSEILELRRRHPGRANEQPHPHRGRDRLEGRVSRRPAGENASKLPERNPGSRGEGPQPFLRDSLAHRPHEDVYASVAATGRPAQRMTAQAAFPVRTGYLDALHAAGGTQRRRHHGVPAGSAAMTAHPTATTSARPAGRPPRGSGSPAPRERHRAAPGAAAVARSRSSTSAASA